MGEEEAEAPKLTTEPGKKAPPSERSNSVRESGEKFSREQQDPTPPRREKKEE